MPRQFSAKLASPYTTLQLRYACRELRALLERHARPDLATATDGVRICKTDHAVELGGKETTSFSFPGVTGSASGYGVLRTHPNRETQNERASRLMTAQKALTQFDGVLVTIRSEKSFFEVTKAIESRLQRFSIPKQMEYVTHADRKGLEAYVDEVSAPSNFCIFFEFEQGSAMRLAGIPVESKFYLVGNAVIARGLFRYTGAAGLGAPVRICVSQRDGEETRIDMDQPSAFFSQFPEMAQSDVPELLDAQMIKVFEDAAA
jgi:uncharacterized protein (DUF302 family)